MFFNDEKIRLCGKVWVVKCVTQSQIQKLRHPLSYKYKKHMRYWGFVCFDDGAIYLEKTSCPATQFRTLLHEIEHIYQYEHSKKCSEAEAYLREEFLIELFTKNRKLISKINKMERRKNGKRTS
jgi:hypothetical protein